MQLEIIQQRAEPQPHEEIGMQIELESGEDALFRAGAAADPAVALEHGDAQAGAREIGGHRQAVVTGSDNDSVEIRHGAPTNLPQCRWCSVVPVAQSNNLSKIVLAKGSRAQKKWPRQMRRGSLTEQVGED